MARLVKLDKEACEELSAWLASKNEAVIDASYSCITFRHSSPISLSLDYAKEELAEPLADELALTVKPLSLAELNERSA